MLLQQAWNFLNDAKYKKAIAKCEVYLNSEDVEFELEAYKLAALAYFHLKDFNNSVKYYELVAQKTDDSEDWFNLALNSTLGKKASINFDAFKKAIEKHDDSDSIGATSIPNMRFFFMKELTKAGKYGKAFEQLNELKSIYIEHEIIDDTYLYMNDTPKLKDVLDEAIPIFSNYLSKNEKEIWFLHFSKNIDEAGKDLLKKYSN